MGFYFVKNFIKVKNDMGLKSRSKMLETSADERKAKAKEIIDNLIKKYNNHVLSQYPRIEEDSEGIITWENPRKYSMVFKGITVDEGYNKTVSKFKLFHLYKSVKISIIGNTVEVEY
jgi:hypothetical protein